MIRTIQMVLLMTAVLYTGVAFDKEQKHRVVAGWVEATRLFPWNLEWNAKLDTGADTSSIHAREIEAYTREGKDWVRFKIGQEDSLIEVERPVTRMVSIKRHHHPPEERYTIELEFCLGGSVYQAEFTLADRSKFDYKLLLGRRFLKHGFLIDPGHKHLIMLQCSSGAIGEKREQND